MTFVQRLDHSRSYRRRHCSRSTRFFFFFPPWNWRRGLWVFGVHILQTPLVLVNFESTLQSPSLEHSVFVTAPSNPEFLSPRFSSSAQAPLGKLPTNYPRVRGMTCVPCVSETFPVLQAPSAFFLRGCGLKPTLPRAELDPSTGFCSPLLLFLPSQFFLKVFCPGRPNFCSVVPPHSFAVSVIFRLLCTPFPFWEVRSIK